MDPSLLLAPVGMEVVSKLLSSIYLSMEGLLEEIQLCQESGGPVCKVAAEMQKLKEPMLRIRAFLLDTDLQRAPGGRSLALLARDAAFGLEDVDDMVEYGRLQSELDPPTMFGKNLLHSAYMLWRSLICCHGVPSSKSNEFLKDLRVAAQEADNLVQLLTKGTGSLSFSPPLLDYLDSGSGGINSQTELVLQKRTVFGRDKERDDILQILLTETCPQPCIVSIVGFGGVGKTTLAQMVYNDSRVERHFDIKSWVFISTGFERLNLAAEILWSAQPAWVGSSEKMEDFGTLQSELQRFVASKKFLIVLDDMWEEDNITAWQDIVTLLRSAGTGSKILVTTRTNAVPHMLGATQLYQLNPLHNEDCWALIKEHTFHSDRADECPDLQPLGREIAAGLHGLPLAAKVVGKVLEASRSKEQWKDILSTLIQDDDAITALRLGYKHLPGHLKRCFTYCSLFPKNWKLDRARLTRLWVAEGFVQPRRVATVRMEDMAEEYFDQLLSFSFIQECKLGSNVCYLMHGLVHDLATSVAAEECYRIEQAADLDIPPTVRHLSVTMNNLHGLVSFGNLERLRTLLVLRSLPFSSNWLENSLLQKLVKLRVLDLSVCDLTELPQSIGNLLHLRYLSIHGTIRRLPESIGKLLHLRYLFISGNHSIEKLPAAISKLVNLRHLGVANKYTAGLVGIRCLVNLQGSLEFHVDKLKGRTLEELRNINGLGGILKIKGLENVSNKEEACRAELNKKQSLNSLSVAWGSAYRKTHPPADAEVLEGLMPHQDLRELRIRRYCGTKAPSWLESPYLQQLLSLHLINCRGLANIPPLGQLRSLRTLHMRELPSLVRISHEFYGTDNVAFPSLSILELDDFPRLCDWSGIADKKSFPCLERLVLMDCPALAHTPPVPQTTSKVTIERTQFVAYMKLAPSSLSSEMLQLDICTSSILFKGLLHNKHIKSIVTLNISGAEHLVAAEELDSLVSLQRLQLNKCNFTDQDFSSFLQGLPSLSALEIIDMPKITSLPVLEKLKVCTTLKEVCIRSCDMLCSVSSLQFLNSLRYLIIERCPKLTSASFPENFGSLSSLKFLRISYCSELQSLPVSGLPLSIDTLDLVGCHPELSRTIKKQ